MPSPRPQDAEKKNLSFKDFGGVDTQSSREAIKDEEFSWLENVFPIGHGNARVVPAPTNLGVAVASGTCFYMQSANIANVDYMFMFSNDGSAYQVNLTSLAVVTLAPAATFSGAGTQACQWKNERLLIIDSNGYFSWDAVTLTNLNGTVLSATLTGYGQGFTSVPSVSFGGPGSGAAATAVVGMAAATIGAGGSGYYVGDVLNVVGGTSTITAQVKVTTTSSGAVTGIAIQNSGNYTVPAGTSSVATTGGFGTGFTLTIIWGVVNINVTAGGTGYTAAPVMTISGGITTNGNVQSAAVVNGGTSGTYAINDVLTVVGGTSTVVAKLTVLTVSSGHVLTVSVSQAGNYTVFPANPVAITGGGGTGATFNLTWQANQNATATANVSVVPSGGTSIASYAGRVWVASARTVVFSAPNSYQDFSTVNAGGSFIVTDETLHSNINQLSVGNNFLYVTGDTSINVIGDVRVNTGITVFSNTNVSSSIGSTYPASIVPYYRAMWFANRFGTYALYGSTTQKSSDALDGVFPLIDLTKAISAAQFIVYNVLCLAFLVQYVDPVTGSRPLLLVFANKKWFFASQGAAMTFVAGSSPSGIPTLYGTDGTSLYELFSDTASNVQHTMQTKLWDMGDPLRVKQVLKLGIESLLKVSAAPSINISVDTEYSYQTASALLGNSVAWSNNNGKIVQWQNNALQNVNWIESNYSFTKVDVSNYGNYIGLTLSASTPQMVYLGFHLQYEMRAIWANPGT